METQARRMVLANNGHHGDSDDDERERGMLIFLFRPDHGSGALEFAGNCVWLLLLKNQI